MTAEAEAKTEASRRTSEQFDLPMRVTLVSPPVGVHFCMQGRTLHDLVGQVISTGGDLSWDLRIGVALDPSGPPRFLGPFPHGSSGDRFLYLCAGTLAGQPESCWSRRVKVPLTGITRKQIEEALRTKSGMLEGRVWGSAGDGGPVCGRVPLLDGAWRVNRL